MEGSWRNSQFKNTFQMYAYSNVLKLFAALLGDLSLLLFPYQIYIQIKGGQFVHNLSMRRSVAGVIVVAIFEIAEGIILFTRSLIALLL